jgi:hypothetical protein
MFFFWREAPAAEPSHDILETLERRIVTRFSASTPRSFQFSVPCRAPDESESFP